MKIKWLWFIVAACGAVWLQGCLCRESPQARQARLERRWLVLQYDIFSRQLWRRTQPCVDDTDVYFSFTNRLAQRDAEPMDLADLGALFVENYGKDIAWQVVSGAYSNYSGGAPLEKAGDLMWLQGQTPRCRDTAWMVNYKSEWLK